MKQVFKLAKVSQKSVVQKQQQWRPFTQSIQLLKEQQHQQGSPLGKTDANMSMEGSKEAGTSSTGMKGSSFGADQSKSSASSSKQGNINVDRTSDTSSTQQQQQQQQASQGARDNMMTSSGDKGIQKRGKRDADSGWMMSPFDNVFRSFDKRFRDLENAFFGKGTSRGRQGRRTDRDDFFGISPTRPFYSGYDFDNEDVYGNMLTPFAGNNLGFSGMNTLAMDVIEHPKSYELVADLPGFSKDHIKVEYHEKQGTLTIQAEEGYEKSSKDEQQGSEDANKPRYHTMERMRSSYYRSFTLPEDVSAEGIKADYKDGVLRITVPKGEAAKAKSIQIGAESGASSGAAGTSGSSTSNKQ